MFDVLYINLNVVVDMDYDVILMGYLIICDLDVIVDENELFGYGFIDLVECLMD